MSEYDSRNSIGYVQRRTPISNPVDNVAREEARAAEAAGLQVVNQIDAGVPDLPQSSPAALQQRQDFSNEKHSNKAETKLGSYYLGKTLGEGEFGKVKLGWRPGTSIQVAVKLIKKEKLRDSSRKQKILREVNILTGLNHPNIVRLHEMVETDRLIGIVLEYAPCGELFNYILNRRYLPDRHAKKLFAQLVSAVGYLHKKGIIHRDLKLENLLLDRNQNLLVTDFGFANTFDPNDQIPEDVEAKLTDRHFVEKNKLDQAQSNGFKRFDLMATSCGSPCYAAPELVISDGLYTGRKVDVWSVGVILYAMLAGYLPYDDDPRNPDGDNITLLYQYISNTDLKFPDYVTPHARDLLKRILQPNPRRRADLFEVARHSWLSGYENVVESITSATSTAATISNAAVVNNDRNAPQLARSASAREPNNPTHIAAQGSPLLSKHGNVGDMGDAVNEDIAAQRTPPSQKKRQTVQVEYMPPLKPGAGEGATENNEWYEQPRSAPGAYPLDWRENNQPQSQLQSQQQNHPQSQIQNHNQTNWTQQRFDKSYNKGKATVPATGLAGPTLPDKDEPAPTPTRPFREPQRSVTDSNFGVISTTRPPTQGSMGGGSRLPSRGSYGQPAAAMVATTSAQGRFSQPRLAGTSPYGTYSQEDGDPTSHMNGGDVHTEKSSRFSTPDPNNPKRGHTRSHTLSDLTQRVFGRTPSTKKTAESRPRPDRSHPPSSMRPPDSAPRQSTDSRHSFGFARKSTEFGGANAKRNSRRFSFIPRFGSSKPDLTPPATSDMTDVGRRPQVYSPAVSELYSSQPSSQQGQQNQNVRSSSANPPTSYSLNQSYPYATTNAPNPSYASGQYSRNVSGGSANVEGNQSSPASQHHQQQQQQQQQWTSPSHQLGRQEGDNPSRFQSSTTSNMANNEHLGGGGGTTTSPGEKGRTPWESENWSSNRKFQQGKSGPAQRVMDFFRGRRHERTGITA